MKFFCRLVVSCEDYSALRRLACENAGAGCCVAVQRNASDCGFCLFFYALFCFGRAVPVCENEASLFDKLFELVVRVRLEDVGVAEVASLGVDVVLDIFKKVCNVVDDSVERNGLFPECVAAHDFCRVFLQVLRSDDEAHRHTPSARSRRI